MRGGVKRRSLMRLGEKRITPSFQRNKRQCSKGIVREEKNSGNDEAEGMACLISGRIKMVPATIQGG